MSNIEPEVLKNSYFRLYIFLNNQFIMSWREVKIHGRVCRPHKAAKAPDIRSRTVLTESHWQFVDLWLTRKKMEEALFYWRQANDFYQSALGLSPQTVPLPLYYCYLNAAKSLLVSKGVRSNEHHGLREKKMRAENDRIHIATEGVKLLNRGVARSLSEYFGEKDDKNVYSLKDLFLNLPFIHRTYILSNPKETEVFIPLVNCRFMHSEIDRSVYFAAELSENFKPGVILKRAPCNIVRDPAGSDYSVRSKYSRPCMHAGRPSKEDIENIVSINAKLRGDIEYINGSHTLWYLRTRPKAANIIQRRIPTLTLMSMHRLSELCRYKPLALNKHLSSRYNWLIVEFLKMSPTQFVDEIASEITGFQFQTPNVRRPN